MKMRGIGKQSIGGSLECSWRSFHTAWTLKRLGHDNSSRQAATSLYHRSKSVQRQQKILNSMIWMLPEMQQRGCEVHVEYMAVVSTFGRALEQIQTHLSYKVETHGCAWGLKNYQGLVVRPNVVPVDLFTHIAQCFAQSSVRPRHVHAPPTSVAQYPGSLRKASDNKLMDTPSSEELFRELCKGAHDEDEVDHDMRRDEKIHQSATKCFQCHLMRTSRTGV